MFTFGNVLHESKQKTQANSWECAVSTQKKYVLRSQGSYRVLNSSKSPEICKPVFQTWKKSEEFFFWQLKQGQLVLYCSQILLKILSLAKHQISLTPALHRGYCMFTVHHGTNYMYYILNLGLEKVLNFEMSTAQTKLMSL